MADKYITPEGKQMLLKLGFIPDDSTSTFNYMALGIGSTAYDGENSFTEASGSNYERVKLISEDMDVGENAIAISATFDKQNYNPSEPSTITEIGIVNQSVEDNTLDQFFAFAKVPQIDKSNNVSLKYTIILEIE